METITIKSNVDGLVSMYNIEVPNECPICHTRIQPIIVFAIRDADLYNMTSPLVSCVLACPSCHELFYTKNFDTIRPGDIAQLKSYGPNTPVVRTFDEVLTSTSLNFIEIFNQAQAAEAYSLDQIAGVGYRKSLEFLIKDYACKKNPSGSENIKKAALSTCINNYINHDEIKATALAATWLGNDETHYTRVWDKMDISNLKSFIEACVFWIIMEGRASLAMDMISKGKS